MTNIFFQYVILIMIILALVMIAEKIRLAYPVILVIGGLLISFTSLFKGITINPEMVFFIFLPPLLYEAAWQVSWKEFWRWRRVIMSFAFPVVIITACVVAVFSHLIIPGFTLALGFLLGGIISPPDAVSATTVMRRVKVPKALISIIEGESLLNDATSLIIFRFALGAVITGQFFLRTAALDFLWVVVMGTIAGLAVGSVFYAIHRWLPVTSSIEIVLTLVTPYFMYYVAELFHVSGVLAVVSGGLFLSGRRNSMLSYQSRVQGVNVWNNLVFVLNGIVFFLIGLQLPEIIHQLGHISILRAVFYGLAISFGLIITRLFCTFGAALFTRFMSRFIKVADPNPGWKEPVITGWAGMRGVVSMAAALSIPILISEGNGFPYRSLILFITFIVIIVTLVFQGLTLPFIIKKVNPEDRFQQIPEEKQELMIQQKITGLSLQYLHDKYGTDIPANDHLDNLSARLKIELKLLNRKLCERGSAEESELEMFQQAYLELLAHQRELLNDLNHKAEFNEDLIRKHLALIDLEEMKIREDA